MKTYIALLRKERDSVFGVDFPDFPGCITVGESLDEAYKRAAEVLSFHVRGMLEDGEEIPEPTSLDRIMSHIDNEGAVPFPVQLPEDKAKRINITISESTLRDIDRFVKKKGISRSAFLARAAIKAMNTD